MAPALPCVCLCRILVATMHKPTQKGMEFDRVELAAYWLGVMGTWADMTVAMCTVASPLHENPTKQVTVETGAQYNTFVMSSQIQSFDKPTIQIVFPRQRADINQFMNAL